MKPIRWIINPLLAVVLSFISIASFGQTPTDTLPGDPGAITVYTVQNMSFGAFSQGASGGTVVLSNSGTRSTTGTVLALNLGVTCFQSIFEIDAPVGTIVSILNGPAATLTGSNGGSMSLSIGASSPASPFSTSVSSPGRTQVNIGGTLTVGNLTASPAGSYTGTFYITFNQE
jgi:hypothetical protein